MGDPARGPADGQHGVVCYFQDVTERSLRERNLAFVGELQKVFAAVSEPQDIMRVVGARLAEALQLAHCLFVDVDDAAMTGTVIYDHHAPARRDWAGAYAIATSTRRPSSG